MGISQYPPPSVMSKRNSFISFLNGIILIISVLVAIILPLEFITFLRHLIVPLCIDCSVEQNFLRHIFFFWVHSINWEQKVATKQEGSNRWVMRSLTVLQKMVNFRVLFNARVLSCTRTRYSKLSHLTSNLQSHGTRLQCKHFGLTVMLQKGKKRQSSKRRKVI